MWPVRNTPQRIISTFPAVPLPGKNVKLCAPSTSHTVQRGGMNLTDRHSRLDPKSQFPQALTPAGSQYTRTLPANDIFLGLRIPQRPRPPSSEECCMSRCELCVHDVYITSLQHYHHEMAALRSTLSGMKIPLTEWPSEIRLGITQGPGRNDMEKEELAAVEVAKRALKSMEISEEKVSWRKGNVWLETVRLVVWVLHGCRG